MNELAYLTAAYLTLTLLSHPPPLSFPRFKTFYLEHSLESLIWAGYTDSSSPVSMSFLIESYF